MSAVYLASCQRSSRRVAIKVLRVGSESHGHHERLRAEQRILASLEHPNIAGFYEAGTTPEGAPYVVMELVEGLPIDVYCDRHRLTLDERLVLFREVCAAVVYAHRNLVVHRDIKPSNILVSEDGIPKLLDFGIAKMHGPRFETASHGRKPPTDTTVTDDTGQRMLTPAYASPEQIQKRHLTTATDIYSLGVLLHALLTGRLPHERSLTLRMQAILMGREPLLPSRTVLLDPPDWASRDGGAGRLGARSTVELAGARRSTPQRLSRGLAGDLDAVILKAIRLSPEHRYATVEDFSQDVWRFRARLPIMARKYSSLDRIRKLILRHRLATGLAAALILLLATTAGVAGVLAARISEERDRVERQRDKARRISTYLVDMFQVSNVESGLPDRIEARGLLDQASRRIDSELAGNPEIQADLFETLGSVYSRLGMLGEAEEKLKRGLKLRRRALGGQAGGIAESLRRLGELAVEQGRYDTAEQRLRQALRIHRRTHGEARSSDSDYLLSFGVMLREKGDVDAAAEVVRQALQQRREIFGDGHRLVADALLELGIVLVRQGQLDEAERLLQESLEIRRRALGDFHPQVADSLMALGSVFSARGDFETLEAAARDVLEIRRRMYTAPHPKIADSLLEVAKSLYSQGLIGEAEPVMRNALAMHEELDSPTLPGALNLLALILWRKGDLENAAVLLRQSLEMRRELFGVAHPMVLQSEYNLAGLLREKGDLEASDMVYRWLLEHLDVFAPLSVAAYPLAGYAHLLLDRGEVEHAESMLEEAASLLRKSHPRGHWRYAWVESLRGSCLARQGRYVEAEPMLAHAFTELQEKRPQERDLLRGTARSLAATYRGLGRKREAVEMDRVSEQLDSRSMS